MGKITKVIYQVIDPEVYSGYTLGEYYFYFNMLGLDPKIDKEYIEYEETQMNMRNKILGDIINETGIHTKIDKTIFGLSSMKQKAVVISEY